MMLKKITVILSQLLLMFFIPSLSQACNEKNFWQSWYPKGQFKGFGNPPEKIEVAKAQYHFAELYIKGKKLTKDYTRALDLYKQAADSGIEQANFKLGLMNHYGKGKAKNLSEAYMHYQKAAAKKMPEAQFNLGLMNRYGIGKKKNLAQAFEWFTKSAGTQYTIDIN